MGKVRNAANTVRIGRIGENTWYVRDGVQIVRQRLNNSNFGEGARRTQAQQVRRVKWGNVVNVWKGLRAYLQSAFENKKQGQSDYNMFMSLNVDNSDVYLTRQELQAGAAVPWSYHVTKGSLVPFAQQGVQTEEGPEHYVTVNFGLENVANIQNRQWSAFSNQLVADNTDVKLGDNIAFLRVGYRKGEDNIPRMVVDYKEMRLNEDDNETISALGLPLITVDTYGVVMTFDFESDVTLVGGCVIRTRLDGGLKVSSQRIEIANDDIGDDWFSNAALQRAIEELGVDSDVILAPGE